MTTPGIITGGDRTSIFRTDAAPVSERGIFAANPGATPKYARNRSRNGAGVDAEYRESMARLFVDMSADQLDAFTASVSEDMRPLAKALAVVNDASGRGGTGFLDFILTGSNEILQEKVQIVNTLTDNYVAFYSGQEAPRFTFQGAVYNTYQDDQRVWMLKIYEEILRGTQLARRRLAARLRYDSFLITGYIESLVLSLRGDSDTSGSFTFQFRVKRINVMTPALAFPTKAQTAPVPTAFWLNQLEDDTAARVADVTPETPADARILPAGHAAVRFRSAQTDLVLPSPYRTRADAFTMVPGVDPREAQAEATAEGLPRILESSNNSDNLASDGQRGLTNVRGSDPAFDASFLATVANPGAEVSDAGGVFTPITEEEATANIPPMMVQTTEARGNGATVDVISFADGTVFQYTVHNTDGSVQTFREAVAPQGTTTTAPLPILRRQSRNRNQGGVTP